MSTFCADSAHWHFYNKRLIKHALFITRVNSNVFAKQISNLLVTKKNLKNKIFNFFFFLIFFLNLGANADPRYKRTRVITRRVLMGLTCNSM